MKLKVIAGFLFLKKIFLPSHLWRGWGNALSWQGDFFSHIVHFKLELLNGLSIKYSFFFFFNKKLLELLLSHEYFKGFFLYDKSGVCSTTVQGLSDRIQMQVTEPLTWLH